MSDLHTLFTDQDNEQQTSCIPLFEIREMPTPAVHFLSRSVIEPRNSKSLFIAEEISGVCNLTSWDISMLCFNYIQKGLLFSKPSTDEDSIVSLLRDSLSLVLAYYKPLAGRFIFQKKRGQDSSSSAFSIFIDCNTGGAEFNHAAADITISDVLSPHYVPPIVESFFSLNDAINYEGHSLPLLSVQVTELKDGIFIGLSFNHSVGDGTSFWNFFNSWAELCRTTNLLNQISRPPVIKRWFTDGNSCVHLPCSNLPKMIHRLNLQEHRDKFFHFSEESIKKLKAKANEECNTQYISSFQALSAHIWRCITRARNPSCDQKTICLMAINNRPRLNPPLMNEYFGNCIGTISSSALARELLENKLGWAASQLYKAVTDHTDAMIRDTIEKWPKNPIEDPFADLDPYKIVIVGSPRFDVYGVDFGWGKAVAARSGVGNKIAGRIWAYPGAHDLGSVDLEIYLPSQVMEALESDHEFLSTVSS